MWSFISIFISIFSFVWCFYELILTVQLQSVWVIFYRFFQNVHPRQLHFLVDFPFLKIKIDVYFPIWSISWSKYPIRKRAAKINNNETRTLLVHLVETHYILLFCLAFSKNGAKTKQKPPHKLRWKNELALKLKRLTQTKIDLTVMEKNGASSSSQFQMFVVIGGWWSFIQKQTNKTDEKELLCYSIWHSLFDSFGFSACWIRVNVCEAFLHLSPLFTWHIQHGFSVYIPKPKKQKLKPFFHFHNQIKL